MENEKRVRDTMGFSSVIEVGDDSSVKDVLFAALEPLKSGYNFTVLVKKEGKVVGMLSWTDLLLALVPSFAKGDIKMEVFWEGLFLEQWKNIADSSIKDLMRPPEYVDIDDTLAKVAYTLVNNKVSLVLVYDQGKMVGTISAANLFSQLINSSVIECSA